MKIEILHVRDPDGGCDHTVFVDGALVEGWDVVDGEWVKVGDLTVEDVDAGRGYTREDWEENLQATRDAEGYSDAFRAACVEAMGDPPGGKYIEGEDD